MSIQAPGEWGMADGKEEYFNSAGSKQSQAGQASSPVGPGFKKPVDH
jgi:hypothetical protein